MGERPTSAPRRGLLNFATATVVLSLSMTVIACGGSADPQDANEPAGDFEVDVTESKFPTAQRIAETSDLVLGVKNTGDEPLPELAFTIETDDGVADGSFNVRLDDASLADPNRPVWILENKYPREQGTPAPTAISGGLRAQSNTYGFGPLDPGETRTIVWRVTPVMPGTYTLNYRVEAGLDGKARAVTADGGEVKGEFVVTISDKPPRATVNDAGQVVTEGN